MVVKLKWPPVLPAGFPLQLTDWGYVKTIAGKTRWICGKKLPSVALQIYHQKAAALVAKEKPMPVALQSGNPSRATMHYILSRWILAREPDVIPGDLKPATFDQYRRSAKRIKDVVGQYLCDDFSPELTKELHRRLKAKWGEDFARRAIGHLRDCCEYAAEAGWCRPVRLGRKIVKDLTARPPARMKWKLHGPEEIRILLDGAKADVESAKGESFRGQAEQFRAMLWLSLNGGYGATELAELPKVVVDLDGARIDFNRGKTGKTHIVPLWPETADAIRPVLKQRTGDELLFRTRQGNPWAYQRPRMKGDRVVGHISNDNFADRYNELARRLGIKTEGQGPYKLKHLACSIADEAGDPHATFALYGHQLPGAKRHYVAVGEDRLRKVVEYVRQRLILNPQAGHKPGPATPARRSPKRHRGT